MISAPSSTISPVMEARRLSLPSILGVENPLVPREMFAVSGASSPLPWTRGRSVPAPSDRSTCRAIWHAVQCYDIFHLPIANRCSGARLKCFDDYPLDKGTS